MDSGIGFFPARSRKLDKAVGLHPRQAATRADIALNPPSALSRSSARQVSRERSSDDS
jgi:hypothetical protein